MTRGRTLVALLLLGHILAGPHAGGVVKRLLQQASVARAAPAGESVARKAKGAAKAQPLEARRIDPVGLARPLAYRTCPPRPIHVAFELPLAPVRTPVALLALAPKRPPPSRSLPA